MCSKCSYEKEEAKKDKETDRQRTYKRNIEGRRETTVAVEEL